jgi:hypothetical protein
MTNSPTTVEKAEVSTRVTRALSDSLHAEKGQYGEQTYRVHSGSGAIYAVDLDGPDGKRYCSCPDTGWCKHLLHVLVTETPETLLECEHGDPRCPGSAAISFEDGEPTCEGRLTCFDCFMEAYRNRNDETATTDTNQPVMADGGQTLTTLEAGQTFTDAAGVEWTIDAPVERVPTPTGEQSRTRLVNETGEIQRLNPRTFVDAVEDDQGEFTHAEESQ